MANGWWNLDGAITSCVAAYQPVGAASYAASLVDLSGNGNDATEGTQPDWDSANGWDFVNNNNTMHLWTGVTPANDQSWSMIIRFDDAEVDGSNYMAGCLNTADGNSGFALAPRRGASFDDMIFWNGGTQLNAGARQSSGIMAIAGINAYYNAISQGTIASGWINSGIEIAIGSINMRSGTGQTLKTAETFDGRIQAMAIYSSDITSYIADLTTAMAALPLATDDLTATDFTLAAPTFDTPTLVNVWITPACRTYTIAAESRGLTIAAESRGLKILCNSATAYSITNTYAPLVAKDLTLSAPTFDAPTLSSGVEVLTLVLQPDSTAGCDNLIIDAAPNNNYATLDYLQIGESTISGIYRSLIKADFSEIPQTATILHADIEFTLVLNGDQRASKTGHFFPCILLRDWVEAQSTWNIYSTGNNWATAGGLGSGDAETGGIGQSDDIPTSAVIGDKFKTYLTPRHVQRWTSGTLANYGLLIKGMLEVNDCYRVASSNHATADYRPKLTVKYIASTTGAKEITFSGDSKSNDNDSWPCLLMDALLTETGTPYCESPARLAVAGYTAAQLHTYVDANIGALSGSPEAVLLNIGANDLSGGASESTFKTNLAGIVDAYITKFPSTVVYVAYPWRVGYDAGALSMKDWIDSVIATYDGVHVKAGHDENVWFKPNAATYSYDGGTHYNSVGAAACKDAWLTILGY